MEDRDNCNRSKKATENELERSRHKHRHRHKHKQKNPEDKEKKKKHKHKHKKRKSKKSAVDGAGPRKHKNKVPKIASLDDTNLEELEKQKALLQARLAYGESESDDIMELERSLPKSKKPEAVKDCQSSDIEDIEVISKEGKKIEKDVEIVMEAIKKHSSSSRHKTVAENKEKPSSVKDGKGGSSSKRGHQARSRSPIPSKSSHQRSDSAERYNHSTKDNERHSRHQAEKSNVASRDRASELSGHSNPIRRGRSRDSMKENKSPDRYRQHRFDDKVANGHRHDRHVGSRTSPPRRSPW